MVRHTDLVITYVHSKRSDCFVLYIKELKCACVHVVSSFIIPEPYRQLIIPMSFPIETDDQGL